MQIRELTARNSLHKDTYSKYEGKLIEMSIKIDDMLDHKDNLKEDWHVFKFYKEKEFRKLENRCNKLAF